MSILSLVFVVVSSTSGTDVTTNSHTYNNIAECNAAVVRLQAEDSASKGIKLYKEGSYTRIDTQSKWGGKIIRTSTVTANCK